MSNYHKNIDKTNYFRSPNLIMLPRGDNCITGYRRKGKKEIIVSKTTIAIRRCNVRI